MANLQRQDELGQLEALRGRLAADTRVERLTSLPEPWEFAGGVLHHGLADYFEVAGFVTAEGAERILFRQKETALAGLVVHRALGEWSFLLNARCEPGLDGLCQFSTTVQSTPSNYEQRHGGAPTPYIDRLLDARAEEVIHDSLEHDWGQYYDRKRKRFLIVETPDRFIADVPNVWVGESALRALLSSDFLVTNDLRSAIALFDARQLDAEPRFQPRGVAPGSLTPVPIDELTRWRVYSDGIRETVPEQGVSIEYYRTSTGSREVRTWGQPLMRVDRALSVALPVTGYRETRRYGVELRALPGLGQAPLYFPASLSGLPTSALAMSAEGGRFMNHRIRIELIECEPRDTSAAGGEVEWLTKEELAALLLSESSTSVELRLASTVDRLSGNQQ